MNYSNPRMLLEVDNWPYGTLKTTAHFSIEQHPTRGERAVRKTLNPKTGGWGAPKALTYSTKQRIVDGDDGKTYIVCLTMYGFISVMQSNMQYSHATVNKGAPAYDALLKLFD